MDTSIDMGRKIWASDSARDMGALLCAVKLIELVDDPDRTRDSEYTSRLWGCCTSVTYFGGIQDKARPTDRAEQGTVQLPGSRLAGPRSRERIQEACRGSSCRRVLQDPANLDL